MSEQKKPSQPHPIPSGKGNDLLDLLLEKMKLRNDAALARALQVAPPVISKIRHGRVTLGDSTLIRIHEASGMPIADIKKRLGLKSVPLHCK